jgi:hypothetical protein
MSSTRPTSRTAAFAAFLLYDALFVEPRFTLAVEDPEEWLNLLLLLFVGTISPQMAAYIASEGLDFGMATPSRYLEAMKAAGFNSCETISRNGWYREQARAELMRLKGHVGREAAKIVGDAFVAKNIGIWERMIPVLDSGEHCPTHLRALKQV